MRLAPETKVEDIVIGGHRRAHFLTAIPTFGMVPIEFVVAFGRMQIPVNAHSASMIVKGMEIGVARNHIVTQVLKMDPRPRYLFLLGDDMIPPWDGLVKLYEEMEKGQWSVLTGMYYWKGNPPTPLMWRNDVVGPLTPGVHFSVGEVVQVDITGMDFTLINIDFLDTLKPKDNCYFKTGPGMFNGKIVTFTEDVWFCDLVHEAGGTVGVHTGVRVAHLDVKTGAIW